MSSKAIIIVSRDYRIQSDDLCRDKIRGCFDHVASGSFNAANDVFNTCERTEPMCRMREIRTGNARKEIFRPAGKPCHFVRDSGAKN